MQKGKESYIDAANEGMIIAFYVEKTGKPMSGMIVDRIEDTFSVKTKAGKVYSVKSKDIIWVKTGTRWPKGVYNILRGDSVEERQKD